MQPKKPQLPRYSKNSQMPTNQALIQKEKADNG